MLMMLPLPLLLLRKMRRKAGKSVTEQQLGSVEPGAWRLEAESWQTGRHCRLGNAAGNVWGLATAKLGSTSGPKVGSCQLLNFLIHATRNVLMVCVHWQKNK